MKRLLLPIIFLLTACASQTEKLDSKLAPAAEAKVNASKTDNDNTKLSIDVKHLAAPNRIEEDANQYIVWITPEGSDNPQNVGALSVNDDLEGRHETTIPYKNFRVFVTPESSQIVSRPTGPIVFDKIIER